MCYCSNSFYTPIGHLNVEEFKLHLKLKKQRRQLEKPLLDFQTRYIEDMPFLVIDKDKKY